MPGMSGLDARLETDHCSIPSIFFSGQVDEKMGLQAMSGEAVKFLEKPFDGAILLKTLERP